jgi:integrase
VRVGKWSLMPSNVYVRENGKFGARIMLAGRQVPLGTFESRELALEAVAAARPRPDVTVGEWLVQWGRLAQMRRPRQDETVLHTMRMCGSFVARFGREPLEGLRRMDVVAWAATNPGAVRYARTVLADAVWAGALEESPLAGVAVGSGEHNPGRIPTEEEAVRIVARVPMELRTFALVSMWSGLRLSEVARLEPQDVLAGEAQGFGLMATALRVRRGKGEKSRTSLLLEPGATAMHEWLAGYPRPGVLFRRANGIPWCRKSVNKLWIDARAAAGLEGVKFHGLRHFHATWLLDRGADEAAVAAQLGHFDRRGHPDTTQVRRTYGHADVGVALSRLERVVSR